MKIDNKKYMFNETFVHFNDRFMLSKFQTSYKKWDLKVNKQLECQNSEFVSIAKNNFVVDDRNVLSRFLRRVEVTGNVQFDYFSTGINKNKRILINSPNELGCLNLILLDYYLKNKKLQFLNLAFKLFDTIEKEESLSNDLANLNRSGFQLSIKRILEIE